MTHATDPIPLPFGLTAVYITRDQFAAAERKRILDTLCEATRESDADGAE